MIKMGIYNFIYKMKIIGYNLLHKDPMPLYIEHYRKNGAIIGNNVRAFSPVSSAEPYLITVGNNVTVSHGVVFLTHDNSIIKCKDRNGTDIVGKITIGNNCFIGCNTIFLPGVEIADNVIVGAGSVVTKSFKESDVIIAGNPAKVIAKTEDFFRKNSEQVFDFAPGNKRMTHLRRKQEILNHPEKLIKK